MNSGRARKEDFIVTFTGQERMSFDLSYDFTLTAIVMNVGMLDWLEALATNASVSGDLNIATYGMVDLDILTKHPDDDVGRRGHHHLPIPEQRKTTRTKSAPPS